MARIPRESSKSKDITGGLPRVAELFEARKPKDHGLLCAIDGVVKWGKDYKAKRAIIIEPVDKDQKEKIYFVPKGKHINVNEGDVINKGDLIVDGQPTPHDILDVLGKNEFANYMVNEVQEVYRLQGVNLNDKHIEVIVRQMLKKISIVDSGDSTFLSGETVFKDVFDETNKKLENQIKAETHLLPGEPQLIGAARIIPDESQISKEMRSSKEIEEVGMKETMKYIPTEAEGLPSRAREYERRKNEL